ncbi:N-acetyltransferase [Paenibacillus sp. CCS19]|uniref:GNAT family N-acetyltransferase n=1 Tax=Paenibacillus sp. CCS19 TaxID=3158387 RepID=UPI002569A284|nr:GNAT family N-acetyltransferase [Paenibacillus cellulosilyticus]GMK40278.1 N-acetyltransferase [Paenibacillus cellulosilyticus]
MVQIRVLEAADAANYHALRLRGLMTNPEAFGSTYERETGFALAFVEERLKPAEDKFTLGAIDTDGLLVGIVTFVREASTKIRHKGNVYGMYTAPEVRGQGVGRALLHALIERARSCSGLEIINLTVVTDNAPARSLYQSLGFVTYGTEHQAMKYEGRYWDEDHMALRL